MSLPTRAELLREEPFTLALSAGFFGFFAHTGFLSALETRGIQPHRVIGASAGALAGGLWSAGMSADVLKKELLDLKRESISLTVEGPRLKHWPMSRWLNPTSNLRRRTSLIFLISVLFLAMATRSFNQVMKLSLPIDLVRKRRRFRDSDQ